MITNMTRTKKVHDFTPIDPILLAKNAGVSIEEVMDFFDRVFGGYAAYVRQCEQKKPLLKTIKFLNNDLIDSYVSYRERAIMKLRCVHTINEVARILNLTPGRIRYLEKLALTKKLHGETNTESQS